MKAIWYLEKMDLFKKICPHNFRNYVTEHELIELKKKDLVYTPGNEDSKIYLIQKGKIKISYYNKEGQEIVKAILTKGEVFGLKSIFNDCERKDFAEVTENKTVVCPIEVSALKDLMRANQDLTIGVYKFIDFKFRKIERHLEILMFRDVKERVIEFINDLVQEFGQELANGQIYIKHPYTQSDIASLLAVSRPRLNTILNSFKQERILDFARNEIFLYEKNKISDLVVGA